MLNLAGQLSCHVDESKGWDGAAGDGSVVPESCDGPEAAGFSSKGRPSSCLTNYELVSGLCHSCCLDEVGDEFFELCCRSTSTCKRSSIKGINNFKAATFAGTLLSSTNWLKSLIAPEKAGFRENSTHGTKTCCWATCRCWLVPDEASKILKSGIDVTGESEAAAAETSSPFFKTCHFEGAVGIRHKMSPLGHLAA